MSPSTDSPRPTTRRKLTAAAFALVAAGVLAASCLAETVGSPPFLSRPTGTPAPLHALKDAGPWIHSPALTPEQLRGKVVLVDFWTYSCINCLRTLPYVRAWAERYKDAGLVVVGVHTPEFDFEKLPAHVQEATERLQISYPVVVDSDFAVWRAFGNRAWPALYFVDAQGRIRHQQYGEGRYEQAEELIRKLLTEAGRGAALPPGLAAPIGAGTQAPPAPRPALSEETYLGYARASGFESGGAAARDRVTTHSGPLPTKVDHWSLTGDWTVAPERVVLARPNGRIAYRFLAAYEWEVSEFSLATYCAMVANGNAPMVGLPVFPSRVFRHGSIFLPENSAIETAADLKGKKVGIPQWTQTAVTYVRGWLQHDAGVALTSIDWIQAGVNDAGRKEMTTFELPPGYRLTSVPDKTLGEMLVSGEIDAVISARPPNVFLAGKHGIKRLIPDYRAQERAYFLTTGIFPIMHLVVLRRDAYEANRWIARNLMEAFEKAKRACLPELYQGQTSFLPTAWGYDHAEETNRMMFPADDPWPYGIENNRKTLEPFLAFCHEQGVTRRKLAVEELFPKEVSFELKI